MSSLGLITAAASYPQFKEELSRSNCSLCPQLCASRHNIVVDRGNPAAQIVLVGEAPGESEDVQGRAFVGRSGRLLDELMASIGIDTNRDTLIINVVKCRPPGNRAPTPQEAAACKPYLEQQLTFVNPRLIVLLGATAVKHMAPPLVKKPMKDVVGRLIENPLRPQCPWFVLFHPAYVLRDPRKKPDALRHLQTLRTHMEQQGLFTR